MRYLQLTTCKNSAYCPAILWREPKQLPFILFNHQSRRDYLFLKNLIAPHKFNMVASYQEFFRKKFTFLFKMGQVIPKKMFTTDSKGLRAIDSIIKQGGTVAFSPEGTSSIFGHNQPIVPGTGRFLQYFGVPVYLMKLEGSYLTSHKVDINDRIGKVFATLSILFTPEQLKSMNPQEIDDKINEAMRQDDYKWNKKMHIKYKSKGKILTNMNDMLYKCPRCGKELCIETKGNTLRCLECGNGGTMNIYNTCFVIDNDNGLFLVDTGGSIEVVKRIYKLGYNLTDINDIFISHSHSDHILGVIWLFRDLYRLTKSGKFNHNINLYCNNSVYNSIKTIMDCVLEKKVIDVVEEKINFIVVNDKDRYVINGIEYTFFDIKAKKVLQYGFDCTIDNKRLVFLGDETLNPELYDYVSNSDYLMHEAFCLDSESDIFKPQEKGHSSAGAVARAMNDLNINNLILYHTEESHGDDRKRLYTDEAQAVFNGNVIVPDDLEIINI